MATTQIYLRPIDDPDNPPNGAEWEVARALDALGDGYVIRWGFFYADESGVRQGEGDFLVLGPDGNVLHIEVKGGPVTYNRRTRHFFTADGTSPLEQRDEIWSQVVRMLNRHSQETNRSGPWVDRVVALPDVTIAPTATEYQTMPRGGLLDSGDLANIRDWWDKRFRQNEHAREMADVFLEVFGAGLKPGVTRHTLSFADRVIEQHTCASFSLLDAVEQNKQLLFCGGPGTGKTWFALEQAFRWGADGGRVLFLTYNLELARVLGEVVARKAGTAIDVYSYEGLAKVLYARAGEKFPEFSRTDRVAAARFFDVDLPGKLREIVPLLPDADRYDALVVDEAQDHNTAFPPEVGAPADAPGWWSIYAGLLRDGGAGRVAAFYDKYQRHFARGLDLFDPKRLDVLFPKLTRVRLHRTMRYTRELRDFFRSLNFPETRDLLRDMGGEPGLPEGIPPEILQASNNQEEKNAVGRVVGNWCKTEICRPEDVLVLYPTSAVRPGWLDNDKLNGVPLAKKGRAGIRSSSVHKAKGLEATAVVLVGFPPIAKLQEATASPGATFTWLMGVTRARHLLAIIERADMDVAALRTT